MKNPWSVFVIIILVISTIILFNAHKVYAQIFARIEGTVKSEDGKSIEGAKVILIFSEDGSKIEVMTDKKGKWKKANIRPGKWTIGFMAEGYEPQNVNVQFFSIKRNKPIDIKLTRIPEPPLNRGDSLYKEKKYTEALQEYLKVLAENQDLYQAYEKMGLCYYRLDDLENAIESFKLMLEREPQSKGTLINLSAIYFKKGNLEEGMKYFERLDEKSVEDPSLFYNIGILLFKNGEIDMAIDYLNKCILLDPSHVNGYYQLALASLNKGEMEGASVARAIICSSWTE